MQKTTAAAPPATTSKRKALRPPQTKKKIVKGANMEGKGVVHQVEYVQRSAKVFFLGCVFRPLSPEGESRNLGKRL